MEIPAYALACSAILAFTATLSMMISAYNTLLSRRNSEIGDVFSLWSDYERYAKELSEANKEAATHESAQTLTNDQHRCTLNFLNFLENICLAYNKNYARGNYKKNIYTLATDIIALINTRAPLMQIIQQYSLTNIHFSEIRFFYEKHKIETLLKQSDSKGTRYDVGILDLG